ncbi:hypothetical protein CCACVL1_12092 [Corchorus capsularis]|uniref:HhH-GPD domain-containing protein n=1 Tax=Corchorus capsularis TaxID=210143 RepID=A0A1R3IHL2_COCAP|nr:hypothetical protein CCACVL1_12092 [Corchorus capsularis]
MSKQGQEQFESQLPWVPTTPFRPILPKPPVIHGGQGNPMFTANSIGSESCSSGLTEESQPDRVVACSASATCAELNGAVNNLEPGLVGSNGILENRIGQKQCPPNLTELSNVPFAELLALANAASVASGNAVPEGINRQFAECSFAGLLPVHVNSSAQQTIWIDGSCKQTENQSVIPLQNSYDLDEPAGKMDALSQTSNAEFAPITPDKATRAERKKVAETEKVHVESITEKGDEQASASTVDVNGVQEHKQPGTESSLAATPTKENQIAENGGSQLVDLERTPQQKQRRKKHRPKVITEGKPRKARKTATPKPSAPQETPTGKRKYVRRNRLNEDASTPPGEGNGENSTRKRKYVRRKGLNKEEESRTGDSHPETLEQNKKTCRRALNFDINDQEKGESSASKSACNLNSSSGAENLVKGGSQSKSAIQISGGVEVAAENRQTGLASEPNQKLKDYISFSEDQAPGTPIPTKDNSPHRSQNSHSEKLCKPKDQANAHDERNGQTMSMSNVQLPARTPNEFNCSTVSVLELMTHDSIATHQADTNALNSYGSQYNNICSYHMIPMLLSSKIYRKKRTVKGPNSATSSASSSITDAKSLLPAEECLVDSSEEKLEAGRMFSVKISPDIDCFLVSSQMDNLKKKRTTGTRRGRDLSSLNGISQSRGHPQGSSSQPQVVHDMHEVGNSDKYNTSIEALVTKMHPNLAKKKRTRKRNNLVTSACSGTSEAQKRKKLFLSDQNKFPAHFSGAPSEAMWKEMFSTDALIEQFNNLDINLEGVPIAYQEQTALVPYNMRYQEHNAIVLYKDGAIVPFAPIKKRRERPKVDLDEETNRVWKLLLQNINSEGIDGTDEEKARWWEEERRVFRGRADSFIARMHLVQGDRRFSPWKGSVLDSVVGVFLTQNVSDHLSSSAFMSLAARFPPKSMSKKNSYHEEGTSLVDGADFYVLEPEDATKLDTKSSIQLVGDQSSMTVNSFGQNEDKEVVNSKEFSGSSAATVSSIYESKYKLLNSSESGVDTCCDSTLNRSNMETIGSVTDCFKGDEDTYDVLSSQNSVVSSENSVDFSLVQTAERTGSCSESNSEGGDQTKQPVLNILNRSTTFLQLLEMAGSARLHEVYGHHNMSTNENSNIGSSVQQDETSILHCQMGLLQDPRNLDESPTDSQNKEMSRHVTMLKHSEEIVEVTESTTAFDNQRNPQQKIKESNLCTHDSSSKKELNGTNASTSQSKGRKSKKEKKDDFDWDSLRKQAEANGKREKTEKTMDSLDWEAVRCADVGQIAETIKARGMNNMLAQRIQDFLNRLVKDHKSIDLEWLRDVPPDKAKEYLLSIRGLGLKSVECVRLLTLHHLAFPVDTNVGRIAVRLGWVPLQPLPESLQLHLLELYELHYQMITFGKVFCTKSKPNCNACPMRGECRHFASAFASARLALPGPEEKSIVIATESRKSDQNHAVIIDQVPLPLPQPTEQSDRNCESKLDPQSPARSGVNNCNPIIEEPASPEPECTQVAENDIEELFYEDPDEIPTIKLNMEEFTQTLQNYMQNNMELQEGDMSKALVALTAEAASLPMPKLKNVSRLRTEHQVYELPDSHPLLEELDEREPDDPCKYLLAIWTPGETPNSIQPPQRCCESQEHGGLCDEKTCFSCNSVREAESQIVRGTLLIPCRTAMRGSFPLNGTYFQVNEVFADHDSSLNPIDVPRKWLWNLPRRMVYFGTSVPSIFKGLTTEEIQHCFWRGYVCVRGFDQKSRAPRPLIARLHFPASKLAKGKANAAAEDE